MKRILSVLVAAVMLCMSLAVVTSAATADIVHQSPEGTAVIDGVKDDAYANALALPLIQKGNTNGGGELLDAAVGTAYYLNDAEYVYLLVEVYDTTLDNTSVNNYEQDSVEVFWMADNSKVQLRFCYDGVVSADTGDLPAEEDYEIVVTDAGYNVELKFPITDVLNNEIETCVQINYCADGVRAHTTYIEGNGAADDAYQRTNRQTDYDVWWTLALTGDHADTRVDPEEQPMELTPKNYKTVQNIPVSSQLFAQDQIAWAWVGVGSMISGGRFNTPLELNWEFLVGPVFDETTTNNYTVDPKFRIQIGNDTFLALPEGAVEGDVGDSGKFTYTHTDIVITADGYADVVIPAGEISGTLQVKQESWGRGGDAFEYDLVAPIKEQLGLDTQGLCTYLAAVTSVKTTITLVSYNLVTPEILDAYLVQLDAEDEALIVELQEYADKVAAALESANAANGDIAVLEEAADEAQKAVNRAIKEAEDYPKATEWANALQDTVDEINAMIEAAKAPAEEEAPADETPSDEAPADDKPATTDDSAEGGATGIIIAVVAVVVIAVVVVIVLVSKKKK